MGGGDGFLDQVGLPADMQVDFGQADFYVVGVRTRLHHLVCDFPFSNVGLAQVFPGENAECVCEGLMAVFSYICGVPRRIVFDNATGVGRKMCGVIRTSKLFAAFWIEAASDDGREAIVAQGAEGDGATPEPTGPEGFVLTERDDAVNRRVRRLYAELDVRRIATETGIELYGAALDEAVDRYDCWQGSNDFWAPACADVIDDVMDGR